MEIELFKGAFMAIKIYVDQGHNPVNPNAGAEGNGLREQDITYRVGQELAALLRADPNYEVRLSRPTADTQLGTSLNSSLQARVQDANAWGADYFISLHNNASEITSASGTEAYVYARTGEAFPLAESIVTSVTDITGLPDRGTIVRSGLYVLRKTAMPAVLVELGFITNPGDAALMNQNPRLFAQGVYQGIRNYTGE
jgi:N-acetylmuramoyl-L-alanine amidase